MVGDRPRQDSTDAASMRRAHHHDVRGLLADQAAKALGG
jgi:hypothetical protein